MLMGCMTPALRAPAGRRRSCFTRSASRGPEHDVGARDPRRILHHAGEIHACGLLRRMSPVLPFRQSALTERPVRVVPIRASTVQKYCHAPWHRTLFRNAQIHAVITFFVSNARRSPKPRRRQWDDAISGKGLSTVIRR